MTFLDDLTALLGPAHVLTGDDTRRHATDWTGRYPGQPLAVARPGTTAEAAAVVRLCAAKGVAMVPSAGLTGLTGATQAGADTLMISVERLNRIRSVNPAARTCVAEAGVVLSALHDRAAASGLHFPLWFGARGSAMVGGALSTNAGGSNVLRYGSARALCLGLEVVLPDGEVLSLMQGLQKDNSGYDLRNLFIGAEGTLGLITAAVLKLVPAPVTHATAMLALRSLPDALALLNAVQAASGGLVEAFEYMPATYLRCLADHRPDLGQPFATIHDTTVLIEIAATAPRDATPLPDGSVPLMTLLEEALAPFLDDGRLLDATLAQSDTQRAAMWARREAAAEIVQAKGVYVDTDIAVPLDAVAPFLEAAHAALALLDPGAQTVTVAHLGDGNLHFSVFPSWPDDDHADTILTLVEDKVLAFHGSFSAEHGVGQSKLGSMARRKDAVALRVMRSLKAALDPQGLMNPGKVLPPA